MTDFANISIKLPKGLDALDFDRKTVMKSVREATKIVQKTAKRYISTRSVSKPGEIPGRRTGRMRRAVKCHYSKRKDRLWGRVQVDTIQDSDVFYPAVLMYGKKDSTLKPRKNFIEQAFIEQESKVNSLIDDGMSKGIKLWN
ncbi:MAG: hypothetical protein ACI4NC_06285 [Succinivibrio sp.]